MSRDDARLDAAPRVPWAAALGVELALLAALLPSLRVIQSGPWLIGALAMAALPLATGLATRWLRWRAPFVAIAEIVVWGLATTVVFFRDTAWLGFLPDPGVLRRAADDVAATFGQMTVETPPLPVTPEVAFFLVSATAMLGIVLDYVVITTRLPLLGAVAVVAVWAAPAVAVPGRSDVWSFVLLGVGILVLVWTEARSRPGADRRLWSAAGAGALAIGTVAVVTALVVTPLLPAPVARVSLGGSGGTGIDASLQLGDDLRRPNPSKVLEVRSTLGGAPYLRVASLSRLEGENWQPDRGDLGGGFAPVPVDPGIATTDVETDIDIDGLRSRYLPVTFPATSVEGLTGSWGVLSENRTVVAIDADSSDQSYAVSSTVPRPTLEQIRGAAAAGVDPAYTAVPADTPEIVSQLADQVTAGATTAYDRAAALQSWFRSSEFRYSLDAPVADGFDGSGVQAVADFLRVRAGYCVHFASAFTLMARELGMPTRIVVGYLPGTATGRVVDGNPVYAVTSDLLHAWPEVYFEGIGWIGFEPTNSLGTPPVFSGSGSASDAPTSAPTTAPVPTASAPAAPSASATQPAEELPDAPVGTPTSRGWSVTGIVLLAIVILLAVPGTIAALRRRRRIRRGGAAASWLLVQETAIDLWIPVRSSDTPRGLGARLTAAGAPPEAVAALVAAIEVAGYAPADEERADPLRDALAVRRGLLSAATPARRALATLAPRSLVVRPGTAFAG
ncbi:DUF3488 and transglutaminase-like domain-containing protein [Microbacterium sp. SORGH_AS_0888]|uniref:transglutaminase family protein n=1 Tax=Microbacterium sp. SORGH_AS_0888 TaxID=3041791 RepID=UPI00278001CF|nr:DUF3488 and transglutaminase-like domain-containing protein [Microbacterium sp. SORGH_AS_0888]MDQ1130828.1 transglutaminase-like putative cysteine protease [Microbacterium sp. SORGH_AS_0888]